MRTVASFATLSCVLLLGCGGTTPTAPSSLALESGGIEHQVTAQATQPVRIVQGTIEVGPNVDHRRALLRGTQGFRLEATLGDSQYPGEICRFGAVCLPGIPVDLSGEWGGFDLSGTVTWRGQTTTQVGTEWGAYMKLTGTFVPPPQGDAANVTIPLTLTGRVDTPEGTVEFEGQATGTFELEWDESLNSWGLARTHFVFRGR